MKRSGLKAYNRKALLLLPGTKNEKKGRDNDVLLFRNHFCVISDDNKTWHHVAQKYGGAA